MKQYNLSKYVVVLGGMGSLAGIQFMEYAAKQASSDVALILYSLASMPDRTEAILQNDSGVCRAHSYQVILSKLQSVMTELSTIVKSTSQVHVIAACNTVHCYLDKIILPQQFRIVSLVLESIDYLKQELQRVPEINVLVLCTKAVEHTRLYSKLLEKNKIRYNYLKDAEHRILMQTIYEGIKSGNKELLKRNISKLFCCSKSFEKTTHILSACTEVPELLRHAKKAHPDLRHLIEVDPMKLAINRAFNFL